MSINEKLYRNAYADVEMNNRSWRMVTHEGSDFGIAVMTAYEARVRCERSKSGKNEDRYYSPLSREIERDLRDVARKAVREKYNAESHLRDLDAKLKR